MNIQSKILFRWLFNEEINLSVQIFKRTSQRPTQPLSRMKCPSWHHTDMKLAFCERGFDNTLANMTLKSHPVWGYDLSLIAGFKKTKENKKIWLWGNMNSDTLEGCARPAPGGCLHTPLHPQVFHTSVLCSFLLSALWFLLLCFLSLPLIPQGAGITLLNHLTIKMVICGRSIDRSFLTHRPVSHLVVWIWAA